MKKGKVIIIAIACICLICGGFYWSMQESQQKETELTEVQKIITKDLENDYPKTPREVIKFYNRIAKCYYSLNNITGNASEKLTEEEINGLVDQMMCLFDKELLAVNPREEYYDSVVLDIAVYTQEDKYIATTDVCDSNEVIQMKDGDDEIAYVEGSFFINEKGTFYDVFQKYVLRKDEEGKWKIITFYQIEGDSSDDDK